MGNFRTKNKIKLSDTLIFTYLYLKDVITKTKNIEMQKIYTRVYQSVKKTLTFPWPGKISLKFLDFFISPQLFLKPCRFSGVPGIAQTLSEIYFFLSLEIKMPQ